MDKVDTNARNISEWLKKLNFYKGENKLIAIADIAYANGADPVMVPQLLQAFEPHELAGYAGWNTAGNTIGTVVAHSAQSEEHTSELQSRGHLVCRLLLEKKK